MSQLPQYRALTDSLRAYEHDHLVELMTRLERPVDAAKQRLTCHLTSRRVVLCAEVVYKDRLYPRLAVPRETFEILSDSVPEPCR